MMTERSHIHGCLFGLSVSRPANCETLQRRSSAVRNVNELKNKRLPFASILDDCFGDRGAADLDLAHDRPKFKFTDVDAVGWL
jgi:hypothetical protein